VVEAGTLSTVEEAVVRLAHLEQHGPMPTAFTFAKRFEPAPTAGTALPSPLRTATLVP
jgi:hypothetical protein